MKTQGLITSLLASILLLGCSSETIKVGNADSSYDDESSNPDGKPADADCKEVDLMTSNDNCGTCGFKCGRNSACMNGKCECNSGFSDCDSNGSCETEGECVCRKGDKEPCYNGPEGTENVGICHGGNYECIVDDEFGAVWGMDCVDEVTPEITVSCVAGQPERDGDCNGIADSVQDEDGDGFAICSSNGSPLDCCDNKKTCNTEFPELINPGKKLDCRGNLLDDDCDGQIDEDEIICGSSGSEVDICGSKDRTCGDSLKDLTGNMWSKKVKSQKEAALALAKAMDMCMDVGSSAGDGAILEYNLSKSGKSTKVVEAKQVSVMEGMASKTKTLIPPRAGKTFALLSSGEASDVKKGVKENHFVSYDIEGDEFGGFSEFHCTENNKVPSVYLSKHGNKLETHPACGRSTATICDSVWLHLKLKAPDTAKGFSFDFRFFSREYPTYVCNDFNDFFMVLATDEAGKPFIDTNGNGSVTDEDANISFDKVGNPVSVNSAFFTTCAPPACGDERAYYYSCEGRYCCPANVSCVNNRCGTCEDGVEDLYAYFPSPYTGIENAEYSVGGGTAWLTTKAPVNPGQIFNLDFYIWDTEDGSFDSTVILDNFKWICEETTVGTDFAPPIEIIN